MMYLDTNIIVYAVENHPKYGRACKRILMNVQNGKAEASSSMLTLVELLSVFVKINRSRKQRGKSTLDMSRSMQAVLSLPIKWLELDFTVVERASLYDYKVSGADYVHIAAMDVHGIHSILSANRELDKIGFIERIDPLDYKPGD